MPEKTADHRHCPACGRSMRPDDRLCSPECEKAMLGQKKRQQRTMWIFMGVALAFMLLLYFTNGQTGCGIAGS